MRPASPTSRIVLSAIGLLAMLASELSAADVRAAPVAGDSFAVATTSHLVVSEVMTGGASASDEFIELYNPSSGTLSLDGLELVYVTASGATVTRKAGWGAGSVVDPGHHVLVANESGIFGSVADVTYANGLAATGGSIALRVVSGPTAIDAVGWGTATNAWLETAPAPAPAAGSSVERLPGGALGSGQDSDHNLVDFVVRPLPDPQNSASPPVPDDTVTPTPSLEPIPTDSPTPSAMPTSMPGTTATPSPTPEPTATPPSTATPLASPSPTPTPSPTPGPDPITIAEARALPDDTEVIFAGVTLSGSDFTEGGGYLADATGGIAVLVSDGSFPRGVEIVVHGVVDDRFAQRTIRATGADLTVGPTGAEPDAAAIDTGAVGEMVEGQLVAISGEIQGSATSLSSGLAYEVDDGSGPVRVLVSAATGIDTDAWTDGTSLAVTGVVGQRDSSGTGSEGYRVQPRDPSDVEVVLPPTPSPSPAPSSVPTGTPRPSPSSSAPPSTTAAPLVTIAQARGAAANAKLRIRGVVTLPSNLVEEGSAVVADGSGAILVRAGADTPRLRRGQLVELLGTRSTKSGMLSLRVTQVIVIGAQAESGAVRRATGRVAEADEALLVVVRGLVKDGPRRTTGGGLSLTVNDGSGALRVFAAAGSGITVGNLPGGAWVELSGVVGQQTTGAEPTAGYRLWPRDRGDIHVIATSTPAGSGGSGGGSSGLGGTTGRPGAATPGPSIKAIRPGLGGSVAEAPPLAAGRGLAATVRGHVPPLPLPMAAGLGALAGLLVLAWRHGTWVRLQAEIGQRLAGGEEDESYTPAP